ncbi:hypothetical protein EDD17DRAFT_706715 [Pisolithus thermaeus]|nr:hypothetical protein EDD17DRAFT_706715 [Pisolithus thermaeus]
MDSTGMAALWRSVRVVTTVFLVRSMALEAASVAVVSVAASEVAIAVASMRGVIPTVLIVTSPARTCTLTTDSSHGGLRMNNCGGYGNSNGGGGGGYVGSGYEPEPSGSQFRCCAGCLF